MKNPKLCKDCKWCKKDWIFPIISFGLIGPYEFSSCTRVNLDDCVSGKPINNTCLFERARGSCGYHGCYWEAKL